MQENDLIGIAGVFILTFFLILLYHFMSKFGRGRKPRNVQINQVKGPGQNRRLDRDLRRSSGKDNDWLLWNPEPDTQAKLASPR